jgi:hypothetical protein
VFRQHSYDLVLSNAFAPEATRQKVRPSFSLGHFWKGNRGALSLAAPHGGDVRIESPLLISRQLNERQSVPCPQKISSSEGRIVFERVYAGKIEKVCDQLYGHGRSTILCWNDMRQTADGEKTFATTGLPQIDAVPCADVRIDVTLI